MTSAHILYIPTIFLLGFLAGSLVGKGFNQGASNPSGITPGILLGSFTIFAIVFIGSHFFEIPRSSMAVTKALQGPIFDKKPSYTADEVYLRIASFPDGGRNQYKQFTYTIDVLFPLTFFIFLLLLIRFSINRANTTGALRIAFTTLPILWLCSDFVENSAIFHLLDDYPDRNPLMAGTLGYITITKFSLLLLSILVPAILLIVSNLRAQRNAR
jgi:hypothetical protein